MKKSQIKRHIQRLKIAGEEITGKFLRAKRLEIKKRVHKLRRSLDYGFRDVE